MFFLNGQQNFAHEIYCSVLINAHYLNYYIKGQEVHGPHDP